MIYIILVNLRKKTFKKYELKNYELELEIYVYRSHNEKLRARTRSGKSF